MSEQSNYAEFRGKCREMSEDAVKSDPSLRLVRGHYICPFWGEQAHWWAVAKDGSIVDHTAAQFPSKGMGEYVEFDGVVKCAECSKPMKESDVKHAEGRYAWCSYECQGRFVGVF